jgi:hypothetical protein
MRDPNARQPRKMGGGARIQAADSQAPELRQPPLPVELLAAVTVEGAPDLKELEDKGLLPKFLRTWNNPATLSQLKTVAQLAKADGVTLTDRAAVTAWAGKNADKLAGEEPVAVQKPITNDGPTVGRNDPCTCGSGKKFKKCCANK